MMASIPPSINLFKATLEGEPVWSGRVSSHKLFFDSVC